uniref:Uncharacterized protein n=1 Tax=Arundo donax TaxID=35708 RepID=A0A0A8XT10_ARUDO
MKYSATPPLPPELEEEDETLQEESSSAPSMESRPALASVVVVVSNTCPPTLNRTRPPPAIRALQRTDLHTIPARRGDRLPVSGRSTNRRISRPVWWRIIRSLRTPLYRAVGQADWVS